MAKRDAVLEQISALSALRDVDGNVDGPLREGLAHPSPLVVGMAAAVATERHDVGLPVGDLREDLAAALERLIDGETRGDPDAGERVKLVRAMSTLGQESPQPLHRAARRVDWSMRPGGLEDVTATLRGEAAIALVRMGDVNVMPLLADLLFTRAPRDGRHVDEPVARIAAAQGLGHTGHPAAGLLLRGKLATDDFPDVLGEAAGALLRLADHWAEDFVRDWLARQPSERVAAAVVPIVEARPDAVEIVLTHWREVAGTRDARTFLHGVAVARHAAAGAFLVEQIKTADRFDAEQAWAAVVAISRDPALLKDADRAAKGRGLS